MVPRYANHWLRTPGDPLECSRIANSVLFGTVNGWVGTLLYVFLEGVLF
jgi:hypothetical protein